MNDEHRGSPSPWRHLAWVVLAAGVIGFTNLGGTHLWDMDEALYSSIARDMLRNHDWVVPTFNGSIFPEKPPLMFWTILNGYQLFGPTEFAARFWSAVCGVLTAVATYALGRRLFGPRVGLWAGLTLVSTPLFTISARAATVDAALTLVTTLTMLLWAWGMPCVTESAADSLPQLDPACRYVPQRWWIFALAYAAMGIGVLGKGPIGLLLPTAVLGMFLLVMNPKTRGTRCAPNTSEPVERSAAKDPRPLFSGPGVNAWATEKTLAEDATSIPAKLRGVPAVLLAQTAAFLRLFHPRSILVNAWRMRPLTLLAMVLAVAGPWYAWVSIRSHGVWLEGFLSRFNLRPFVQPILGHHGPIWYHVPATLVGFFPWSPILIPALFEAVRRVRARHAWRPGYVLLLCWFGVYFVFWSLCSTKLPHYLLPAYPALALLTGCVLDGWLAAPAENRLRLRPAAWLLIAIGAGVTIGLPIAAALVLPGEWWLGLVGLILVLGGAACWRFSMQGQFPSALNAYAVTAVAFLACCFGVVAARVDRHQNAPTMLAALRSQEPGAVQLGAYRYFRESMVYYSGQSVQHCLDLDELRGFLAAAAHPCLFTPDAHLAEIEQAFPGRFRVVARQPRFLARGDLLLLAQRPDYSAGEMAGRMGGTLHH